MSTLTLTHGLGYFALVKKLHQVLKSLIQVSMLITVAGLWM